MQQAIKLLMDNIYQTVINGEEDKALQVIEQLADKLDIQTLEKKTELLNFLVAQIKSFMISDYELETFTALLCIDVLIRRNYMVASLYDSIKIGFSSKHKRIIQKTVQIIKMRPLQQQEYNVLLTIAMDYFKSRNNKSVAILQFVELFQLVPEICKFQLEQSGSITKDMWQFCVVRQEDESAKCLYLLCKLFPSVCIQQIDAIFKGTGAKTLQQQGSQLRLLFQKHGRDEFSAQFQKDMKYASETYVKFILSKTGAKDVEYLNEYFKLIAVIGQFADNLDVLIYQQIFDKLMANCYKVELFTIVRFLFKFCADGSKIRQFIPVVWLKYQDYTGKVFKKIPADLLEGLLFCTEHCRMNVQKNMDQIIQFYIIQSEITDSFVDIVEILSQYENHNKKVRGAAFAKISEYIAREKYIIVESAIVQQDQQAAQHTMVLSFVQYLRIFLKMDFRYQNILEYIQTNVTQYLDSDDREIRSCALEIILNNLARLSEQQVQQHVDIIKQTVDFIFSETDNAIFVFGLQRLMQCESLHLLLYLHYIQLFTVYLLDYNADTQDAVLCLLGKLLRYDDARISCVQLRNVFQAKMKFASGQQVQESFYNNLMFVKMAIQHCAPFLQAEDLVFDSLSQIQYQKLSERESIALIQTYDQLVRQYHGIAQKQHCLDYFCSFIHYFLNQDIYSVNKYILRFLQQMVNSTGVSVAYYLLIPNLQQRLIYLIKNSKNYGVKEEAVNCLVTCGPINYDVALEQVDKGKLSLFYGDTSMRQLILAKYVKRDQHDSELLTHGNIYFDDINQTLVDYDSIIYSKDSQLITKIDVIESVLAIIKTCLTSDQDLVLQQAANVFRLICFQASTDGFRLNVIQHVKNICASLRARTDTALQQKILINLVNTVAKIDHCVNIVQYDIVDACLSISGNKEQILDVLSLLEEVQLVLLQAAHPLEMYRKSEVIDLLVSQLLQSENTNVCKRCLQDLLLFKSHFQLNGYQIVPLLLSTQRKTPIYEIRLLCIDVLLRFLCFLERREQLATIIFGAELTELNSSNDEQCSRAILQLLIICCINNYSLIEVLIKDECFAKISHTEMYEFVIALHLMKQRGIGLAADQLQFLFDQFCQQLPSAHKTGVQKLFKSESDFTVSIPQDSTSEKLVSIFIQYKNLQAPTHIVLPYQYGKNNMLPVEDKNDDIIFNLWQMSQCTNEKEWETWFQKFVYHSIRLSNCKYLSFCSSLAEVDLQNQQQLFNSAILFSLQEPGKIEPRIQKLQQVVHRVLHKSTPNNIQLCFMNLIDFLNKYQINTSLLVNQDTLFDISEQYQAFTRSLRIRESQCNLFRMDNYLDSLFQCYQKLQFRELANSLLQQEQQILDSTYLFYIHSCFAGLLKHLDDNKRHFGSFAAMENIISKFQPPSILSVQSIQPESKQFFFENLFLDLTNIQSVQYTSENLAKTVEHVLTAQFEQYAFLTSQDIKQLCQSALNCIIFHNRERHQKIFNPKPSWLLLSDNYDEAIALLDEQINFIETYLKSEKTEDLDKTQIRELFQEHYNLTNQLVGALFLQGQYAKLQQAIIRYTDIIGVFPFLDQQKKDKQVQKFNTAIAHLMVQINIDNDKKVQEWLNILPKEHDQIRLLSQAISQTKHGTFIDAKNTIQQLRQLTCKQIQTTIQENYQRSYEQFIVLVYVLHLQQVIDYRENGKKYCEGQLLGILTQQTQRLMNIHPNVDYWQTILKIRNLLDCDISDQAVLVEYAMLCIKNHRYVLAREILDGILGQVPHNGLRIHKNTQHQYYLQNDNFDVLIPEIKDVSPEIIYAYGKLLLADSKIENQIAGYMHLLRLLYNHNENMFFCDKLVAKLISCLSYFSSRQRDYQLRDDVQYKSLVNQSITNIFENYSASVTSDAPDPSDVTTSSSYSRGEQCGAVSDKSLLVCSIVAEITSKFTGSQNDSVVQQQLLILERAAEIAHNNDNIMFLAAQASYKLYCEKQDSGANVSIGRFATTQSVSASTSTCADVDTPQKTQSASRVLEFYFKCQKAQTYRVQSGLMILQIISEIQNGLSVEGTLKRFFEASKADYWLPVLPQIITYSMSAGFPCASYLRQILLALAATHCQLVLPQLVVAAFTEDLDAQREMAKIIDIALRNAPDGGAAELMRFNAELARVAHSALEEAYDGLQVCIPLLDLCDERSRLDFFEKFAALHQSLSSRTEVTEPDYLLLQFATTIKPALDRAWELFKNALMSQSEALLDDVKSMLIDISCRVWEQISEQGVLDLESLSQYLFNLRNSSLRIPGTQQLLQPIAAPIYIARVVPRMTVIQSKQRPRKLAFVGSDGEVYAFLLKGKEDLRQDERVMQFLRFADSLMHGALQQLRLHAYPVIPLTCESGLIFWVPNTNSLQNLIQQQKLKQNDYDLQIQFRAAHYSVLSLPQRIDALKFAVRQIPPTALNQALFALSSGSEAYIRARGNFTRTLAAASAAGHVLGLGDRHPGNILLNREMHVVHIDYGDCFEVAMQREKYPEKVVFRLTRMMESALDVCGRHGAFLIWFRRVLQLLRDNQLFIQAIFKGFLDRERLMTLRGKLEGREKWQPDVELTVEQQADVLIDSAANMENLCQAYFGWAPFW